MSHSEDFQNILDRIWNHPENNRIEQISAAIRDIGVIYRSTEDDNLKVLCLAAQEALFAESARIIASILDESNP